MTPAQTTAVRVLLDLEDHALALARRALAAGDLDRLTFAQAAVNAASHAVGNGLAGRDFGQELREQLEGIDEAWPDEDAVLPEAWAALETLEGAS